MSIAIPDHRETPSFSKHVTEAQTVAPISIYRDYSGACLRVEIRNFVGRCTANNDELGLVRHAPSFKYLNHFTSRFYVSKDDKEGDDDSVLTDNVFGPSEDTKSPEAVDRHMVSLCKKRARDLNVSANELQ